ncbi:MAG: phosphoribosylaminoimidazolesuccinocarboxamide synthase [Alphaproteobacteria bacterium]|jgi:phosphoribosylaminoimidazole-succinocarboxamide synthase|nr:phosphoribosylaminoimidazolesuccinocarboxamide synthase [Alphaproteobacteria bacterium]|tara:strand:- start:981 stop:1712 length:732 start_codon:yes stop_codon:yes gene_type:complete
MSEDKRKKIYEGKAKILYKGPQPNTIIQYFKDDATAFNNKKFAVINGKGVLNNRISAFLMEKVKDIGIPTHFIKRLNMREQLVHSVDIIPIEVVIRNVAAGSICKRFGLKEGEALPRAIVEYYYKSDELNDPLVSDEHITAFEWANSNELEDIFNMSLRINDFLLGVFSSIGIKVIDFKLEFGRFYKDDNLEIILADELSPDNFRLWDNKTNKKLDKDRFREDLGNLEEAYQEVAERLGVLEN